jgi:hypothetical protein
MTLLKLIGVGTDFSEASDVAMLDYGRAVARTFGAPLHLLHLMEHLVVCPCRWIRTCLRSCSVETPRQAADGGRDVGELPGRGDRVKRKGAQHRPHVLPTHGRGAMAQLLVSSVAEELVRTATCAVPTVRHPGREFVVPDAGDTTTHQKPGGL